MESDQTLLLKYGERAELDNGVFVTYCSYDHEHVSYGPDEPFAATLAIYIITLDSGDSTCEETDRSETVYLPLDIRGICRPETIVAGGYSFCVSPESSQDVLVLRWRAVETCR